MWNCVTAWELKALREPNCVDRGFRKGGLWEPECGRNPREEKGKGGPFHSVHEPIEILGSSSRRTHPNSLVGALGTELQYKSLPESQTKPWAAHDRGRSKQQSNNSENKLTLEPPPRGGEIELVV